jgi:Domain of unknown function (DUF5666)/Carboxypeptidase regulatory-like domain
MHFIPRTPRRVLLALGLLPALLLALACGDSNSSPTAPGGGGATGTLAGTVIQGASSSGMTTKSMPIGLAGVTVRVSGNSHSTMTDSTGQFTLTNVPAGNPELSFERQDIHARGRVTVAAGATNHVTIAIVGSRAEAVAGGHSGLEIEGLVSSIDSDAGTFTVLDQRQGAVVILTDGTTVIRDDNATISLSDIAVGDRVHVKALTQDDGSILATQVLLQSDKVGGSRQLDGPVVSVDQGAASFVVQAGTGAVTVTTNGSTTFKRHGGSASFSDLAPGVTVDINGTLQGDGTVLAKKVTIES